MSNYTSVLLLANEGAGKFDEFLKILEGQSIHFYVSCHSDNILAGQINYLPSPELLVAAVNSLECFEPGAVQLFVKAEGENKYHELSVSPRKIELVNVFIPDPNGSEFDEFTQKRGRWEMRRKQ